MVCLLVIACWIRTLVQLEPSWLAPEGPVVISHNYAEEINDSIAQIPNDRRAWPRYRDAYIKFTTWPDGLDETSRVRSPSHPEWAMMVQYFRDNTEALKVIRSASLLGPMAYPATDGDDELLFKGLSARDGIEYDAAPGSINPMLIHLDTRQISVARMCTRALAAEARIAARSGESQLVVDDLLAMGRLAQQIRDRATPIQTLVSIAILALRTTVLSDVLTITPEVLSNDQLEVVRASIAAEPPISAFDGTADDRMAFLDLLQRWYTDDGDGDGEMTIDGFVGLMNLRDSDREKPFTRNDVLHHPEELPKPFNSRTARGLFWIDAASRSRVLSEYNSVREILRSEAVRPRWEWSEPPFDGPFKRRREAVQWYGLRYCLVQAFLPDYGKALIACENSRQVKDAALVGIALESFHRREGAWPQLLSQLVPRDLPSVPLDRHSGGPISCRLIEGRPLVYSVGVDGDDDLGRPTEPPDAASWWRPPRRSNAERKDSIVPDGDWVLWPAP